MKTYTLTALILVSTTIISVSKQEKSKIIAKNATVEKAATGFLFTEGPAIAKDGRVYFTDQPNDRIHIWDQNNKTSLFLEGTGRSNGMYFNAKGQLIACADENNQLVSFNMNKERTLLHEGFNGLHLNAPNDLWITPNQGIYFTDPYYHRKYWSNDHKQVQDTQGVYYLDREGNIIRVIDDYKKPNGIIGTPDGKTLYVADIEAGKIWQYNIQSDGRLTNKTLFAPHGSDGMTIDHQGNIYLTSGKIWVYNPKGKLIETIEVPESPSNVCFGGKKRNTLFITARTSVYTLKMKVHGVD
ncbi:SMP-30/gluconolactonase/LRE family protein [Snuella lapsa]|uniref:SMP-30/gluconolactonase/LRE family protein n=1 Tax=Snuella lapsa TaxID=870481 RepID=A0ABP6Y847_9FLAO